jgi:membrane protein
LPWLLRRSVVAAFDDNCFSIAKGAAYSALLSFFPVLTSAATILVQTRAEFVSRTLASFLSEVLPPGTQDVVITAFQVRGARPVQVLIVAGLFPCGPPRASSKA